MPQYRKNADGYYKKSIVVGRLPNGNQKREIIRSKSLAEFKEMVQQAENLRKNGHNFDEKTLTVDQWAERWYETYKASLRENSKAVYRNAYDIHIKEKLAALLLKNVRPVHIQAVMQDIAGQSESLQNKVLFTMRQIFETAIQNRLIPFNPCDGVKITPHTNSDKIKVLSPEQQEILMSSIKDSHALVFCALCLYAGLRREEALGLQWTDIDRNFLTVNRAASFLNNNRQDPDHSLKTKAAHRTIPIPAPLSAILAATPRTDLAIVTTVRGGEMTYQAFVRLWNRVRKAVPFDVHPHMLRHSYATALYRAGVDLKTAQVLLGHTNIAVTAQVYTHVANEQIASAGQKIEAIFGDRGQNGDKISGIE